MLDQQNAMVFFNRLQQHNHAFGFHRAHARQRFVEQNHLRLGGQRHGNFQLALLAVADGACNIFNPVLQATKLDSPFNACAGSYEIRSIGQPLKGLGRA